MKNNKNYKIKLEAIYDGKNADVSFETNGVNGLELIAFLAGSNVRIIENEIPDEIKDSALTALVLMLQKKLRK